MKSALLLCVVYIATTNANADTTCNPNDGTCNNNSPQCQLYLAPSTIPFAGLGLFTGGQSSQSQSTTTIEGISDLYIPLADPHYKAYPYRGQQRFPSWLRYIWPAEPSTFTELATDFTFSFPAIPSSMWDFDPGLNFANGLEFYQDELNDELYDQLPDYEPNEKVSAFVPGMASLMNNHEMLDNVERVYESGRADNAGMEAPWHAGVGAFTPHHGVKFVMNQEVIEGQGMELLLHYGEEWNTKNDARLNHHFQNKKERKEKANLNMSDTRSKQGFVEPGIHKKWDAMNRRGHYEVEWKLPTEKAKREGLAEGVARDSSEFDEGEEPYSEYRKVDYHPWTEGEEELEEDEAGNPIFDSGMDDEDEDYPTTPEGITKSLPWLEQNGVCMSRGKLRVESSPIGNAGRGLFATAVLRNEEVVASSPLIAMREEDFIVYKSDETQKIMRNVIDKSIVRGKELLLNYAFTHSGSPLYLIPSAPLVNFINHGGPKANVEIRWPKTGSNTAKLFEWAYNQKHASHFDNDFDSYSSGNNPNPWLKDHPIDVMERSGKLAFDYVALRDIKVGDEILIDYGKLWDEAWVDYAKQSPYARSGYFRHAIGVPEGLFPENWLNVSDRYEIAEINDLENKPLEPGVVVPMTWAHNGKPLGSKYAYVIGMGDGFSDRFLDYSEKRGVVELYRRLLTEQEGYVLRSDAFDVYRPGTFTNSTTEEQKKMEFFAHRYKSLKYKFNMHFVASWDEAARKDLMQGLGNVGFDIAVKGIGERFGYQNLTCFHASYMGVTHCDKSLMHSDIYASNDKSWNIVFPLITVEGTEPELEVMAEDINTIVGVHYLKDVAYAMGDHGYHKTRPIAYYDPDDDSLPDYSGETANGVPIRVVFGAYCSQIDETNVAMISHIYDGDDPAPFAGQFTELPMKEVHWEKGSAATLARPGGKK